MAKLSRERVHVSDEDVKKAYEAYYGEKIQCQIIFWPADQRNIANKQYEQVRTAMNKSEQDGVDEFERVARSQATQSLAASAGKLEPFAHNTTGEEQLERIAFGLHDGEMSHIFEARQGWVCLRCVKHLPPDTSKKLEEVRPALEKEVFDKRLQQEIGTVFVKLQEEAKPKLFMHQAIKDEEIREMAEQEMRFWASKETPSKPTAPHGN
jgi:parvulin-like peptidyl-prolyl isomerase